MVPPAGANTTLQATRSGAIPSRALEVCTEGAKKCPNGHEITIRGTKGNDSIRSDKRPSVINGYGGRDKINLTPTSNANPPVVNCGPGKDVVLHRAGQKFTARNNCEKVKKT